MKALWSLVLTIMVSLIASHASAPSQSKTYQVRGVVRELRPDKTQLVIKHEEIPGYMESMIMPFTVHEPKVFKAVKPGDIIEFRLTVNDREDWIDQIKVITHGAPPIVDKTSGLDVLKIGDQIPDLVFIDEKGIPLRLFGLRGKAVAFTFMFTRCPFPKYCPLLATKFRKVQSLLAADSSNSKNCLLLSVTIDPERDTPTVLNQYAQTHDADPIRWRFATGELQTVTTLALRCGVNFWEEKGVITHNLRTMLFGADGRLLRIYKDNSWKEEELVAALHEAALQK